MDTRGDTVTQPTDDDLIAYLERNPGSKLRALCKAFDLPCTYEVKGYSGQRFYTDAAKALAGQLQRLRRAGKLRNEQGQRWEARQQ